MNTKESSRYRILLIVAIVVTLLAGCINEERRPGRTINPNHIYFDYRIWGDEERNMVTVTLQFREGGIDGDPIALDHPARVEVDGVQLEPDSSKMNGVYYEVSRTVNDFEGDHSLVFTDQAGKTYKEEFYFSIMELKAPLPSILPRKDLTFELGGLDSSDFIHVILTDTSFYGRGIDRVDTVRDGRVTISRADLENLHNGPVFLEFYKEENWPLKETTPGGGRLSISYSLKRAFELTGPVE